MGWNKSVSGQGGVTFVQNEMALGWDGVTPGQDEVSLGCGWGRT